MRECWITLYFLSVNCCRCVCQRRRIPFLSTWQNSYITFSYLTFMGTPTKKWFYEILVDQEIQKLLLSQCFLGLKTEIVVRLLNMAKSNQSQRSRIIVSNWLLWPGIYPRAVLRSDPQRLGEDERRVSAMGGWAYCGVQIYWGQHAGVILV